MAQHDYVISNGTGAAVRSDLNNALLAIVSQNSGATEPTTTYAYQWWADTTTGLLKIRNSANNAWITLRELDGTLTVEDGTVSAPGLAFRDDLNTGIWRPGTDQFAISTNGVERVEWGTSEVVFNDAGNNYDFRVEGDTNANLLFVDASADAVGIGTSSPSQVLDVQANDARFNLTSTGSGQTVGISIKGGGGGGDTYNYIESLDSTGAQKWYIGSNGTANTLAFKTNGNNERMRIDSSGRVGIGTASAGHKLDLLVGGGADGVNVYNNATGTAYYQLATTSRSYKIEATGSDLRFYDNTGSAERARIDSAGRWLLGTSTSIANNLIQVAGGDSATIRVHRNLNDVYESVLLISKARGTGYQTVLVNDVLGKLIFQGADGTGFAEAASIASIVEGTPATGKVASRLVFSTTADGASSPTERMRITNDGKVFIGTTSAGSFGTVLTLKGSTTWSVGPGISSGTTFYVVNGGGTGVYVSDGATSWTGLSDERLKTDLKPITSGLDKISSLRAVTGRYISDTEDASRSFLIAQDVQTVLPEAVDSSNPDELGLRYTEIIPLLVAALKESKERIEQLEAEMAEVKTQLA